MDRDSVFFPDNVHYLIHINEKAGLQRSHFRYKTVRFYLRVFNPRLLEEEVAKRSELERLHLQQQRVLSQTEAEKQELEAVREAKERELSTAMEQLDMLEKERQGALQQFEVRRLSFGGIHWNCGNGSEMRMKN